MTTNYPALVTSEYADKPNFLAVLNLLVESFVKAQDASVAYSTVDGDVLMLVDPGGNLGGLAAMPFAFDLDLAIGSQLDALGLWIGFGRSLFVPVLGNIKLSDDDYRTLLRAKVAANSWDGSMQSLQRLISTLFPGAPFTLQIIDNQDMTLDVFVIGTSPTPTQMALLTGGLLIPRPEGVLINGYLLISSPLFGLDSENAIISGLDVGSFANYL